MKLKRTWGELEKEALGCLDAVVNGSAVEFYAAATPGLVVGMVTDDRGAVHLHTSHMRAPSPIPSEVAKRLVGVEGWPVGTDMDLPTGFDVDEAAALVRRVLFEGWDGRPMTWSFVSSDTGVYGDALRRHP